VSDAPEQIFMNPDMDVIDRSDIDRLILALRRPHGSDIGNKAADLIHSLTEALAEARILSMIEPTGRAALDAVVAERIKELEAKLAKAVGALEPMAAIAHAYDENELDDEARKFWGRHYEHENHTPHDQIELYQGRGGKRLLTLEDCMKARATLAELTGGKDE
jgi:hypothetical protein